MALTTRDTQHKQLRKAKNREMEEKQNKNNNF